MRCQYDRPASSLAQPVLRLAQPVCGTSSPFRPRAVSESTFCKRAQDGCKRAADISSVKCRAGDPSQHQAAGAEAALAVEEEAEKKLKAELAEL